LRQKALQVLTQYRNGNRPAPNTVLSDHQEQGDDELALFGGQTRILVTRLLSASKKKRKTAASSSVPCSTSPSPLTESESLCGSSASADRSLPEVHPSLVEYLSTFPPSSNPPSNADTPCSTQASSVPVNPSDHYSNAWLSSSTTPDTFSAAYIYQQRMSDSALVLIPGGMPSGQQQFAVDTSGSEDIQIDSPENSQLLDMGMMVSGESGMDEQWISFMRDSGIMNSRHASRRQFDAFGNTNLMPMGRQDLSQVMYS